MHEDIAPQSVLVHLSPINPQVLQERGVGVLLPGYFCRSLGIDLINGTCGHDLLLFHSKNSQGMFC